jgi:CHAT domain-containing protein
LQRLGNVYTGTTKKQVEFTRKSGDLLAYGKALSDLGRTYQIGREYTQAEQSLLQAIAIWEKLRVGLEDKASYRISLFETQTDTYQALQQVRIALQKYPEALEAAEQGRARAFAALLSAKLNSDRIQQYTEPKVTAQQLQQIARDQKITIVSYSLISPKVIGADSPSRGNSQLYAWVISPTGEISFRDLDLSKWEIDNGKSLIETIQKLQEKLTRPTGRTRRANPRAAMPEIDDSPEELPLLYQLLIFPIEQFLPKDPDAKVVFVPHDALFLVPFATLRDSSKKYLIEKHTISYSPSIQLLDSTEKLRDRPKGTESLIIGNPTGANLPDAEVEANAIAKLFNSTAIIGKDATKAKVLEKITNSQIIHFGTHGEFNDQNGLNGAIILANNISLTAEEILQLKLKANLVVLSACNTAKGKITGDGVIGLSRAFILAGTPSIVVSLWSIPDAPTGKLMVEFYDNIQKGSDRAQALRQAMIKTMRDNPHPRDWAAFTLIGSRG